ncbi:MAG TPA: hypothetical protein DDZ96_02105 [Porphyromonadaceae bacterium]|jgi:hypothetical protein|nr:hypothetical protein [Porphyromonadaceae bacterium]
MKKFIIIAGIFLFGAFHIFPQSAAVHIDGGRFLKRIEYNGIARGRNTEFGLYNLESKSVLEKIFFGEINSPVEYVFRGSPEGSNEALALRIIGIPEDDSCRLEVMKLEDMHTIYKWERNISAQTNEIVIPHDLNILWPDRELIQKHNKEAFYLRNSDSLYQQYRPAPKAYQISRAFAGELYRKISSLIDRFKGEGIPPTIHDGYEATFRCAVENEVWTLTIHIPQWKALELSNLCRQIIADGLNNEIDESKYLKLLDEIN